MVTNLILRRISKMSSKTYFLEKNPIDGRHKVVDQDGFPYGDADMPDKAIQSARALGITDDINFGSGVAVVNKRDVFTTNELISELANLAGMKVRQAYDDNMNIIGWTMELIE